MSPRISAMTDRVEGERQPINWRRAAVGLLILAVLAAGGYGALQKWMQHRRVFSSGRMEPPPEVVEWHNQIEWPFDRGLEREERNRRMRAFGMQLWRQTTLEQRVELARGHFPDIARELELSAEQMEPIRRIYEHGIRQSLMAWDGWGKPDFNTAAATVKSVLIAEQCRTAAKSVLNEAQQKKVDNWMAEAQKATGNAAGAGAGGGGQPAQQSQPNPPRMLF